MRLPGLMLLLVGSLSGCAAPEKTLQTDLIKTPKDAIQIAKAQCFKDLPGLKLPRWGAWHAELHQSVWDVWYSVPGVCGASAITNVKAADGTAEPCGLTVCTG